MVDDEPRSYATLDPNGVPIFDAMVHNKRMDRRSLLRALTFMGCSGFFCGCSHLNIQRLSRWFHDENESLPNDLGEVHSPKPSEQKSVEIVSKDYLQNLRARSAYFYQDFPDDIYFTGRKLELVKNLVTKFRAVQRHVGYGNFNIMGMDEFFRIAALARGSSPIDNEEKLFLEEIFYFDARKYGFQGEKVVKNFTETVPRDSVVKVPYTGHFLRKGAPLEAYEKITREVGSSIVLTSGVRALAKQYYLFFEKGLETKGNMSKASRSLAPPGYSFHGQGDFDVGKRGFGLKNFTDDFATTEEYKKLLALGYVEVRYPENNLLGVRFEPWHIKVHEG